MSRQTVVLPPPRYRIDLAISAPSGELTWVPLTRPGRGTIWHFEDRTQADAVLATLQRTQGHAHFRLVME